MSDQLSKIIVNNIRRIRKSKNMTQDDIVRGIGSGNYQQINKYESGVNKPGDKKLAKIAEVLGVSVSELVTPQTDELSISTQNNGPANLRRQFAYELLDQESDEELEELISKLLQKKKIRAGGSPQE